MRPLKPNHELIPILTFRVTQCHDLDRSWSSDVTWPFDSPFYHN